MLCNLDSESGENVGRCCRALWVYVPSCSRYSIQGRCTITAAVCKERERERERERVATVCKFPGVVTFRVSLSITGEEKRTLIFRKPVILALLSEFSINITEQVSKVLQFLGITSQNNAKMTNGSRRSRTAHRAACGCNVRRCRGREGSARQILRTVSVSLLSLLYLI